MAKKCLEKIFVWFTIIFHFLFHYFYLVNVVKIEKFADWFDLGVYPVIFSLVLYVLYKFNKKITFLIFIPIIYIYILFLFSGWIYYKYFQHVLTISNFIDMVESINSHTVKHVFNLYPVLLFVFIGFFIGIFFINYYLYGSIKNYSKKRKSKDIILLIAAVLLIFIQPVRVSLDKVRSKYRLHKVRLIVNAGYPYYLIYDYIERLNTNYKIPQKKFKSHFKKNIKKINIDKPNYIFIIQVESLDYNILNYKYNKREVTPFINKISKKSLFFNNFYANHNAGSSDADYAVLTGILPLKTTIPYNLELSHLPSLAKYLKQFGYTSFGFHPVSGSFFNRKEALDDLELTRYFHYEDFKKKAVGWNSKDTAFYNQSLGFIEKIVKNEEKAIFYLITVQSHGPFKNHSYSFIPKEKYKKKYKKIFDYFNSINEADMALKSFFNIISKNNIFDESLFFIFSDHCSGVMSDIYKSKRKKFKKLEQIPLLIYSKNINPNTLSIPGEHIDIPPTIAYILNHKKNKYWLGENILNMEKHAIFNENIDIYLSNNKYYYNGSFYDKNWNLIEKRKDQELSEYIYKYKKYSCSWFYD